jgi:two-component system nitrogen regulation sensor histidine kinase NtrY
MNVMPPSDPHAVPHARRTWPRWWRRMQVAARRANLFGVMVIASIIAFLVMTTVTFVALFRNANDGEFLSSNLTATLLVGTLVPALAILVLLGRWMALRRAAQTIGGTGRMHVRLVFIFSIIAAVPTLLVVIFASYLFQSGVEFWFSDNSRGLIENANKLARGYYEQSQRDVSQESLAMASDLRGYLGQNSIASPEFPEFLYFQVRNRKLDKSAILQKGADGKLRTAAIVDPSGENEAAAVKPQMVRRIDAGEPFVVEASANRIVALTPIDRASAIYLYTSRSSDLLAFSQGQRAENIVKGYEALTSRARLYQLRFNVALFIASLALVGLSVWFALRFADRQVKPLYELVDAARRVGSGNFALRVEGRTGADEIGLLNRAFNRMTAQIEKQTQALLGANVQLQERRVFIEAVFESVTSGIISIDADGAVMLMNSTAQKLLLERALPGPLGLQLAEVAPQIAALVASGKPGGVVQYNKNGELLTLTVKLARDATGHVITFEDITRQLLDQRQAAWSDVAQRIAHEIKNPLTPIQLATERLSRRYRKQIHQDPELFEDLTRTIIRQVGDLRKMVDEFSSFARLPKPIFRPEDPAALTRQALFLQEVARPDIAFAYESEGEIPIIGCDRHQFGQAMTNVLKNAVEAVEAKAKDAGEDYRGRITVRLVGMDDAVQVRVTDNGIGLPQDRDRIIEPYVTTREKGTGLGLAIVNKIVEEHGGEMTFTPAQGGGTTVTMRFAADPLASDAVEPGRSSEAAE